MFSQRPAKAKDFRVRPKRMGFSVPSEPRSTSTRPHGPNVPGDTLPEGASKVRARWPTSTGQASRTRRPGGKASSPTASGSTQNCVQVNPPHPEEPIVGDRLAKLGGDLRRGHEKRERQVRV